MDDLQETDEMSDTSNNAEQLEFLEFLKSLDEVPQDICNMSNDGEDVSEPNPTLNPQVNYSQLNERIIEPELAIPHITISMPEGQFLSGGLNTKHAIPEISISFSNLPPVPTTATVPIPVPRQFLPISERSKSELQEDHMTLQKHNFVHKLYLAASSEQMTFLNWAGAGAQLQVDYIALQDHLNGTRSMFRSYSVQQFIGHILDIGFERVTTEQWELVEKHPQLFFQHKNFRSGHQKLLLRIPTPKWELPQTILPLPKNSLVLDSSYKTLDPQSPLQLARCRFQMLLHYHNDVRLLQLQEPTAEQLLPRRGRISSGRQPSQVLTPCLANKHVNPRDSVLQFEEGHVPEYAGFYGRAEPALISEFFAEYLPRYGTRISGYKDIVVDASKANSFQQNLPIGIVYSEDEDDLEEQECTAVEMKIYSPETVANSIPEDIELEQVMQELCGIVPDAEEQQEKETTPEAEEQQEKVTTPPKSKLKRKKQARKCAIVENNPEHESSQEEIAENLIQAAAEAASAIKDELKTKVDKDNSKNNSKEDAGKDTKCQSPKREVKRRRYDLRNSKPKRFN